MSLQSVGENRRSGDGPWDICLYVIEGLEAVTAD